MQWRLFLNGGEDAGGGLMPVNALVRPTE